MHQHLGKHSDRATLEVLGEQLQGHAQHSTSSGIEDIEELPLVGHLAPMNEEKDKAREEDQQHYRHGKTTATPPELFNPSAERKILDQCHTYISYNQIIPL